MHTSVRSLHLFDARSVLLFAAIATASASAIHARAADRTSLRSGVIGPSSQPAASVANSVHQPLALLQKSEALPMTTSLAFGPGNEAGDANNPNQRPEIEATRTSAVNSAANSAFDRADTNKDGQLSAAEARRLPAISERFQELDTNHDGYLSHDEFDAGAKF